jgi:hypothetical protein
MSFFSRRRREKVDRAPSRETDEGGANAPCLPQTQILTLKRPGEVGASEGALNQPSINASFKPSLGDMRANHDHP